MVINHVLRGEHTLLVKRSGYDDYTTKVNLGLTDFARTIDASLKRTLLTLTIKGLQFNDSRVKVLLQDPEDTVSGPKEVGQWDYSESSYIVRDVIKGKPYTLVVKRPGYRDFRQEINLDSNLVITPTWIVSVAGEWTGTYTNTFSYSSPSSETRFTLTLSDSPTATSSQYSIPFSGTMQDVINYTISDATVSPSSRSISFKVVKGTDTYNFSGTLDSDFMRITSGNWYITSTGTNYGSGTWTMSRSQTPGR
jgi:hypothetical protein